MLFSIANIGLGRSFTGVGVGADSFFGRLGVACSSGVADLAVSAVARGDGAVKTLAAWETVTDTCCSSHYATSTRHEPRDEDTGSAENQDDRKHPGQRCASRFFPADRRRRFLKLFRPSRNSRLRRGLQPDVDWPRLPQESADSRWRRYRMPPHLAEASRHRRGRETATASYALSTSRARHNDGTGADGLGTPVMRQATPARRPSCRGSMSTG